MAEWWTLIFAVSFIMAVNQAVRGQLHSQTLLLQWRKGRKEEGTNEGITPSLVLEQWQQQIFKVAGGF